MFLVFTFSFLTWHLDIMMLHYCMILLLPFSYWMRSNSILVCCGDCSCDNCGGDVHSWDPGWSSAVLLHQQTPIPGLKAWVILSWTAAGSIILPPTAEGSILPLSTEADRSRIWGRDKTETKYSLWDHSDSYEIEPIGPCNTAVHVNHFSVCRVSDHMFSRKSCLYHIFTYTLVCSLLGFYLYISTQLIIISLHPIEYCTHFLFHSILEWNWPEATDDKEIVYVSDYFCLKWLLFLDVYQRSKTKSVDPGAGTLWCLKYCPSIQWRW